MMLKRVSTSLFVKRIQRISGSVKGNLNNVIFRALKIVLYIYKIIINFFQYYTLWKNVNTFILKAKTNTKVNLREHPLIDIFLCQIYIHFGT